MFVKTKGIGLGQAPAAILMLVLIGLVAMVGEKISSQIISGETSNTTMAAQAAYNTSAGITQITQNLSLVGLILIMAIIIGVLWTSFGGMLGHGGSV